MVLRQRALLRSLICLLPSTLGRRCLLRMARVVLRLRATSQGSFPPKSARRWQVLNLSRLLTSVRPTLLSLLRSFSIPLTAPFPAHCRYSRRLSRIIRPIFFIAFEFFSLFAARLFSSLLGLPRSASPLRVSSSLQGTSSACGKIQDCSGLDQKRGLDIYSWEASNMGSISIGSRESGQSYWSQQLKSVVLVFPKNYWRNSSYSLPMFQLINYYSTQIQPIHESYIALTYKLPTDNRIVLRLINRCPASRSLLIQKMKGVI